MKYWLTLIISFMSIYSYAADWWYQGYVITNDNELIKGQVYVPPHSQANGAVVFIGIDLEGFYERVKFKSIGGNFDYSPSMIKEFGFSYIGVEYKFESSLLYYKSIVRYERQKPRFLNVVYRGTISMLRDCRMLQHDVVGVRGGRNLEYLNYYDYYLQSEGKGLIRLFSSKETTDIKLVLESLGMNSGFLHQFNKVKVRTLKSVLVEYDEWLKDKETSNALSL